MNAQGPTPPGWYPDSQGVQRWYDGTRWTEHTQPPERPAAPQYGPDAPTILPGAEPPSGPPAGPPTGPPGGKTHRGALIAVVVAAVLLVAGGATATVLLLGSDDGDDKAEDDPTSETTTDEPTGEPTEEPIAEPTGDPTDEPTDEPITGPEEDPAAVVERFVGAALAGDCTTAEALVTRDLLSREGGCEPGDFGGDSTAGIDFRVGEAAIDGETASVPVILLVAGSTPAEPDEQPLPDSEFPFDMGLVVEDEVWKIDDFGMPGVVQ